MPTVLCATPDGNLCDLLAYALGRAGCVVRTSRTWPETLAVLDAYAVTLALLDETLPAGAPDTLQTALRRFGAATRTIVLAARTSEGAAVACLQAGADDYVARTISPAVLIQRVLAILQRRGSAACAPQDGACARPPEVYRIDDVTVAPAQHEVRVGAHAVQLTGTQSALLAVLCQHLGQPLPSALLAAQIPHSETNEHADCLALKTHIHQLRVKLAALPGQPLLIRTYRAWGYGLERRASGYSEGLARQ